MSALGPDYVLMCRFENEATGLRSADATGIGRSEQSDIFVTL